LIAWRRPFDGRVNGRRDEIAPSAPRGYEALTVAALKFNHLFAGLMAASFVTAFVLPNKNAGEHFGMLQGLLRPVSSPARWVAHSIYDRLHRQEQVIDVESPVTPRAPTTIYEENEQLRTAYASLKMKFDQLAELNADRSAVGDIRKLCRPATVSGGDSSALRETLTISSPASASTMIDSPVIRGNASASPIPCDLIGKVIRGGPLGAQVRLVTDPGFVLNASIGRYETKDGQTHLTIIEKLHPLIKGIGHNQMAVATNYSVKQVQDAGLAVGDLIMLDDHDGWPLNIQGFTVGRITSIGHQLKQPQVADIRIEPDIHLMRLTEVMVMVKH
jgi:cell shape-determining protein MreC